MTGRFDPRFPRQTGWPRAAIAVSVLLHVLLFLGPVEPRLPDQPESRERVVIVTPPAPADDPPLVYRPGRDRDPVELPTPATRGGGAPVAQPSREAIAPFLPMTPRLERPPADTGPGPRRGHARVAPEYGNGLLWVRPVPVSPAEIARRLEDAHFEQVDSAVTAIMQAYLDSLAAEPGAPQRLPEWTTRVAGSKFGLDSRYIYIAGLKIPAAVLALLPWPQGNIDQARAYNHLMEMRADIEQAARRAENMAEFKQVIQDIRERKQRERDFQRAQREAPPPPPPQEEPATP